MKAFIHGYMVHRVGDRQNTMVGGNRTPWSILAVSSSIYFGRTLRVLAVFPGSTYSGYSSYCKVFRMFVRQVLLAYSGFCILLIMFPALAVFGLSVLPILPALAALIQDTVLVEYRNDTLKQYPEYRTEKYITSCTGSSVHYPQIVKY